MLLNLITIHASSPIDITHFVGNANGLSYTIARFVMHIVEWILGVLGLDNNATIVTFLYASVILCISILVGVVVQWVVLRLVMFLSRK